MWNNPINKTVQILLNLANLADEKKATPFEDEMGLGYRAFSSYVREGAQAIIALQGKYYSAKESEEYAKENLKDNEELLEELFGRKDAADFFTDGEKARIRAEAGRINEEAKKEMEE